MLDLNPLLQDHDLPPFSTIRAGHLIPATDSIVQQSRDEVARIIDSQQTHPNWDDLVLGMEVVTSRIENMLGVIRLLDGVHVDTNWKDAYRYATREATDFIQALKLNEPLFECYQALAKSAPAALFDTARKHLLKRILDGFRLVGIELAPAARQRLVNLNHYIAGLEASFLYQLEQANNQWRKHISDESQLIGLLPEFKQRLVDNARAANLQGWLLTLSWETYESCLTHAQDRTLREQVFVAYNTRASESGPYAGQFDNGPVLRELLVARHEKARLLGYPNFVQLALESQMTNSEDQVLAFIRRQIVLEKEAFAQDKQQLEALARELGLTPLQPWDYLFLAQKIRQQTSGVSEEEWRAYFPLDTTLVRLFEWVRLVFGIEISEVAEFDSWAPGVRLFQVAEFGEVLGYIYFVPYLSEKYSGVPRTVALKNRWTSAEGHRKQAVAVLYGQFQVAPHTPFLLTHQKLKELFHEFGHSLHQVLIGLGYRSKMGIDELSIDSSEFCGKFFESWCDSAEGLVWLSSHFQTSVSLSEAQVRQHLVSANTQATWDRALDLTLALFDIEVHRTHGDGRSVEQVFASANREVGHLSGLDDVRLINGVIHMVEGYAGVLYSYRWSEVLAQAAFKRFEREGVFNKEVGRAFREHVMAPGDSRNLLESLQLFLGAPPEGVFL